MLKAFILFVLSSFLISCNENMLDINPVPEIGADGLMTNEDLQLIVKEFELRYGVSINFTVALDNGKYTGAQNSSGTTIGVCREYYNGKREVLLNQAWFLNATYSGRKVLTFHELVHCQFNRGHDNRLFSNGMPMSIMYPIINPILNYFDLNFSYYLDELVGSNLNYSSNIIVYSTMQDGSCVEEGHFHE